MQEGYGAAHDRIRALKINIVGGDERRVAKEVLAVLEEGNLIRELEELNARTAEIIERLRAFRAARANERRRRT